MWESEIEELCTVVLWFVTRIFFDDSIVEALFDLEALIGESHPATAKSVDVEFTTRRADAVAR